MDLNAIRILQEVARRGSFAAVARDRNVDPSSISRDVALLEAALGFRLFQRTTRRMALTEAGDAYLARVTPLIEELEQARETALNTAGAPKGLLRFTASVTFGQVRIVPLLAEFRGLYPEISLDCLFTDANLDLVADRIDLAVRLAPGVEGDLIAAKLMDVRYRVVASRTYLAANAPLARPTDLAGHRCLLSTIRAYRSRWLFRDAAGEVDEAQIGGDITISPVGSIREAAEAGLGPALLPDWLVAESIAAGRLVDVFPDHDATATTFGTAAWLVYPARGFLPGKVRAMADFLRARVGRSGRPTHLSPAPAP